MQNLLQDVRYGLRMMFKRPGFTAAAIISLALGIGATTTIFSVVNAVLLRSLPYVDADRLVVLWETNAQQIAAMMKIQDHSLVAPGNFTDWAQQGNAFEGMAAARSLSYNWTGSDRPERVLGASVTPNLFSVLGVRPVLGRAFLPEDAEAGRGRVVVLSQGLWQRRFGADPNVLGRTLTLNNESFSVVGVMPQECQYPENAELWALAKGGIPEAPGAATPNAATLRTNHYLVVIARLKPGATLAQAQAEMNTISSRLQQQYPDTNNAMGSRVVSMHEELVGDIRPLLLILLGVVGFVLLIACANVANLLLARSISRQRELSLRTALGASRARIVRQLMTESLLLGLIGGGLGLFLSYWGVRLLVAFSPADIPRVEEVSVDGQALLWTVTFSLLAGLLAGLAPALQTSQPNMGEVLKESGRSANAGVRHQRMRGLLVVAEVALTLLLLTGAGLLLKSFMRLQNVDPGFDPQNVLTMRIALPGYRYSGEEQFAKFSAELLARVKNVPGVAAAALSTALPLSQVESAMSFRVDGRPGPPPGSEPIANWRSVSPDYFRALGTPLLSGRAFTERDVKDAPGVVIVNESMARSAFPGGDALGQRLIVGMDSKPREIIGVVGDVRHSALKEEPKPELYVPYLQAPKGAFTLAVRTTVEPESLTASVTNAVQSVDKDQPVYNVKTLEQFRSASLAQSRFNAYALSIFAAIALVMAAVGIYGVMAYSVTQRTREMGIRIALGAQPGDVLRLVVRQGMVLALLGIVVGLAASLALTRVMSGLLYGVAATDLLTFVTVSAALALIALTATYLPARRATRVDPMIALRYE
jgi:putative ABC transport system permease protein